MHSTVKTHTDAPPPETICPGAFILRGYASQLGQGFIDEINLVAAIAPFRYMTTPNGKTMSVAMTNCGSVGWVSSRHRYEYTATDPETGAPWPSMPTSFHALATQAADHCGFRGFDPDACLINRYKPGAKMGLHKDRDERDFSHPIVSVSLGIPAVFLLEDTGDDPIRRIALAHGDVVVFGGPARRAYHGVEPIRPDEHPLTGRHRINLTFRKAL